MWETDAQYSAFLAYRDVGANRSVDAAFEVHSKSKKAQKGAKKAQKGAKKDQKSKRAGGGFRAWAKDNEWSKRASEYDASVQEELDAVKLEAKKQSVLEIVERMKYATLDAGLKLLEKTSLEKVRKKYAIEKDGRQVLTEIITEQQSILASPAFVEKMFHLTMPDVFGKAESAKPEEQGIIIVRNVITQSDIHSSTGTDILSDNATA